LRQIRPVTRGQRRDDQGEARRLRLRRRSAGPKQRHGLGEIAHIIVGQAEQDRVRPLGDQRPDQARLGVSEHEPARDRRKRIAAFGIGRRSEEALQQRDLAVASRLIGQGVEKLGEVIEIGVAHGRFASRRHPDSVTEG
jgi:hypothetical protein